MRLKVNKARNLGASEKIFMARIVLYFPFSINYFARENLRCDLFLENATQGTCKQYNACENLSLSLNALWMRKYTLCGI